MSATWPAYEHVNVQVGLDAWLAGDPGGRSHEVYGITGIGFMRHMEIVGIGDFLLASGDSAFRSAGAGGVMTEALPSGPDGQTRACVSYGGRKPGGGCAPPWTGCGAVNPLGRNPVAADAARCGVLSPGRS